MNISRQIIVKDETFILPIQIDDMDLLDRPEIIYLDSETIKAIFQGGNIPISDFDLALFLFTRILSPIRKEGYVRSLKLL